MGKGSLARPSLGAQGTGLGALEVGAGHNGPTEVMGATPRRLLGTRVLLRALLVPSSQTG